MRYISDIINTSEIEKWKPNDKILISAQTGSGKSYWVLNTLYNYAKKTKRRILILSNRVLLKRQLMEIAGSGKGEYLTVENYQKLEKDYIDDGDINELIDAYDYIVYDEVHYIFHDSMFNPNTDILLENISNPPENKIIILITATPKSLLTYTKNFTKEYSLEKDYSYLDKIYYYNKDLSLLELINSIPENEKIIYFGPAEKAEELYKSTLDSKFICSTQNKKYSKKSSISTMDEIVETNNFSCRILCSTKVIDNGISIVSDDIKHIIIDILDIEESIQCLGRLRINDKTKITLYIRNYNGSNIFPIKKEIEKTISVVDDFMDIGRDAFDKKYSRRTDDTSIIRRNGEINYAKYYYILYMRSFLRAILLDKDKNGYIKIFAKEIGVKQSEIISYKGKDKMKLLQEFIDGYAEKKLYKEDIEKFKSGFFDILFKCGDNVDLRKRGMKTINDFLEEENVMYAVTSRTERPDRTKMITYWWIAKI